MSKRKEDTAVITTAAEPFGPAPPSPPPPPPRTPLEQAQHDYNSGAATNGGCLYTTVHGLRNKYPLVTMYEKWQILRSAIDKLSTSERLDLCEWLAQRFEDKITKGG